MVHGELGSGRAAHIEVRPQIFASGGAVAPEIVSWPSYVTFAGESCLLGA